MSPFLCQKALAVKVGAFFILSSILVGCANIPIQVRHSQSEAGPIVTSEPKEVKKASSTFTVSFVGDVILHERLRKREEVTHEGYNTIWQSVQPYIDAADISYANLEGPVAPEYGGVTGFPRFNFPEQIITDLKNNGIDIVSTANNHALDRDAKGIRKTLENLKKNELAYTGTVSSHDQAAKGIEKWWGLTPLPNTTSYIAWLACTEMTNGHVDKEELVMYCYKDQKIVEALIQQLKAMPDIAGIIVTPHWGEEEEFDIAKGRTIWAKKMLDLGALAVVGSHPHVVQRIEDYTTTDKRNTFIAYSLGNFVSNQPWTPNKVSMMLLGKFTMNQIRQLEIVDLKYIPLWMVRSSEKDGTSKFRIQTAFDFKKFPSDAVKIWKEQLGEKYLLKTAAEAETLLQKQ